MTRTIDDAHNAPEVPKRAHGHGRGVRWGARRRAHCCELIEAGERHGRTRWTGWIIREEDAVGVRGEKLLHRIGKGRARENAVD